MTIRVKRAYEPPASVDGERFLVDRVWPRGRQREDLKIVDWLREVAPSDKLRKWFDHDPDKWPEFVKRYHAELEKAPDLWSPLLKAAKKETITLVFGAKDEKHNQAVALKAFLDKV